MNNNPRVRIPGQAVSSDKDVGEPVRGLLRNLRLLGAHEKDGDGFLSTFTGPPQSVALIEAGATAVSKWWAAGLGAVVIAIWANVIGWWNAQASIDVKVVVIAGAAFVTGTIVLAIGHLLASDVRGRAAAAVANINARARVAEAMLEAAKTETVQIVPRREKQTLFEVIAKNLERSDDEELIFR
jgi:hypothetical protein